MISKKELQKDIVENLSFAKESMETGNGVLPAIFIRATKGKQNLCHVSRMDDRDFNTKNQGMFRLGIKSVVDRVQGKIDSIDAVYLIAEAWMSSYDKNKDKDKKKLAENLSPSEDPNRREVIMSSGMNDKREMSASLYEIKKFIDKKGEIKVDFVDRNDVEGNPIQFKSGLLDNFWNGVALMEDFIKEQPVVIPMIERADAESLVETMMSKVNRFFK